MITLLNASVLSFFVKYCNLMNNFNQNTKTKFYQHQQKPSLHGKDGTEAASDMARLFTQTLMLFKGGNHVFKQQLPK